MVTTKFINLAWGSAALMLYSCAPKAIVVVEQISEKKPQLAVVPAVAPVPAVPAQPDDGIRLPEDMLAMPGESDFRATTPASPTISPGSGAVTVRPPTDSPSRPKTETPAETKSKAD